MRDFDSMQNADPDSFLEATASGVDTAEASRQAALKGMEEISALYKAKGEQLYLSEGD